MTRRRIAPALAAIRPALAPIAPALVAALAAALVAACGAKPPEALPRVEHVGTTPSFHTLVPQFVSIPRPPLPFTYDLPDLSDELRWPLSITEHPNLEPHFPVARVLAEPGISWTDLCARGVQNRRDPSHRDELAYLGAWCAAEKHDTATAITTLAPLAHSSILELSSAVPFDIAFILAASEDADHADKLMRGINLKDARIWDMLAASYYEVSKDSDALYATGTAVQLDPRATDAASCHRLARQLMLGTTSYRDEWLKELRTFAAHKVPAQACVELAVSVPCVLEKDCAAYLTAQQVPELRIELINVFEHWPKSGDREDWLSFAWLARRAWPTEGSIPFAEAALDAVVATTPCASKALEDLAREADQLAFGIDELRPKAAWVHELRSNDRACEDFHLRFVRDPARHVP